MDDSRVAPCAAGFSGFVLHRARGALHRPDGTEVVLRPKTFDVLEMLVARRGSVVSRDTLLSSVWPDVTVTDESVTQCVGELRRALGPEYAGLLRTLPRRGYILDDSVAEPTPAGGMSNPLTGGAGGAGAVPMPVQRALPRRRFALFMATLALLASAVGWHFVELPRWMSAYPREQAASLTDRANRWFEREAGAAAWRGQRDLYARAVDIDPTHAPAWVGLAFTNANLVHYRHSAAPAEDSLAAERAAERAYALAPNSAESYAAVGAAQRLRPDRLEESMAAFQRAFELSPSAFASRAQLGWMLAQFGRAQDGEVLLRAALVMAPPAHPLRPSWYYYLGMIDLLLDRGDHGVAWLRQALAAGGGAYLNLDQFQLTLAAALALNGQISDAAATIAELRNRQPLLTLASAQANPPWSSRDPVFLAQLGKVYEGLRRAGLQ